MPSMNPATVPSTGLDRWRYVRTGGSSLFTAWRTRRRWTPNFRATPLIVPISNSYSRRNCSNSSTFVLLSTPPLPLVQRKDGTPREKGGPNSVSKVGRSSVLRSFVCTTFGRSYPPDFLLCDGKYSVAQKVESGAAVHGALDDLQPVDLSLDRPCAPGQRQGGMHSIAVLTQAPGKTVEVAGLSGRDPGVELVGQAVLDHGRERPGQVGRPGDRRRQLEQRGHESAVILTQLIRLAHQQAHCLARGRRFGRLGRWCPICGRSLTALAGGPLADDAR